MIEPTKSIVSIGAVTSCLTFTGVMYFIDKQAEPANDPEIAQTGIDFVYRLLPQYINILMQQSSTLLENFFIFTLRALTGRDPLPKYAAADFWVSFL
jgi:hypothetical protein